jgi:hypothetical protein
VKVPDSVEKFREQHRAAHIGPRYRGWLHFGTTTVGAAAAIVFAAWHVVSPSVAELATIPVFFLVANTAEYFGHRGPMHHRRRGLMLLFERHSLQHHQFFTDEAMAAASPRDFQMVLFPPLMLAFFLGGVAPIGLVLGHLIAPNVGWLFVATGVGYFLLYEWLHFAYHQPETSWIGRRALVARLRRHHTAHHDLQRMTKVNFNITFPIGDLVFGTLDGAGDTVRARARSHERSPTPSRPSPRP